MVANLIKRGSITRTSRIEGAPLVPYVRQNRYRLQPWLRIPKSWPGSNLEWIVWWYLSIYGIDPNRRKLIPNRDFYWQRAQTAPGLFIGQGFTRSDFVLPGWPGAPMGLVFDPITNFTHKSAAFDLRKRQVLCSRGWKVIFFDGLPLMSSPRTVIEAGLDGRDLSRRGGVGMVA